MIKVIDFVRKINAVFYLTEKQYTMFLKNVSRETFSKLGVSKKFTSLCLSEGYATFAHTCYECVFRNLYAVCRVDAEPQTRFRGSMTVLFGQLHQCQYHGCGTVI